MGTVRTVFLALLLALACLPGCGRKDKIIPREKMVDIYADMFLADQWIRDQGSLTYQVDTMRFYEPLFRKYGYTTLDFRNSANYYLQDPRRFARILQRASSKLEDHAKYLERLSTDIETIQNEIRSLMESASIPPLFYDSAFFARSGSAGYRIEMEPDEWGAWMPVFPFEESEPDPAPATDTLSAILPAEADVLPLKLP